MGCKFIVVLVSVLAHLTTTAGSTSSSSCQLKRIQCWASCDLGNCGYHQVTDESNSFVRCSLEFTPPQNTNFTIGLFSLQSTEQPCYSEPKCNHTTGICEATFNKQQCDLILEKFKESILAHASYSSAFDCHVSEIFKICEIAKPDPPIIELNRIHLAKEGEYLKISDSREHCHSLPLEYRLNYTWTSYGKVRTKKSPIIWDENNSSPPLPLEYETAYNFTLERARSSGLRTKRVYSDPAVWNNYITRPGKATDSQSLRLSCTDTRSIIAKWQKTGIIDYFTLEWKDTTTTENATTRARVKKESPEHTEFKASLRNVSSSWEDYAVTITAHNAAGNSSSETKNIERHHCGNLPTLACNIVKTGSSFLQLKWNEESRTVKDELWIVFVSGGKEIVNVKLENDNTTWMQNNLQSSQKYEVSIVMKYGGYTHVLCKTIASTSDTASIVPPIVKFTEIKARFVIVQVGQDRDENNAGKHTKTYWVKLGNRDFQKVKNHKKLRFENLTPNTEYILMVSAQRSLNFSKNYNFKTTEAAPDDSPQIVGVDKSDGRVTIAWKKPKILNGNITRYELRLNESNIRNRSLETFQEKNCDLQKEMVICVYDSEVTSTTLHNVTDLQSIQLRACTGDDCTDWSTNTFVDENKHGVAIIVLSMFCGVFLIMVALIGIALRSRKNGPPPVKPRMHPNVQMQFNEELLEYHREHEVTSSILEPIIKTHPNDVTLQILLENTM